ncbi:hypothetical protein [Halovivax gelatinilyticus]|uniref:hypothetical protein n=1 Tax=Halovivax gelatinilyticus TaxID=2961597 RepID=UPI0020CA3814|nr:hypothetical protein [Halovivax gelatinilyticus]
MSALVGAIGALESDDGADRTCYRCGRDVAPHRLVRLSAEPRPAVRERYRALTRECCLDCAAAIGMLEFSETVLQDATGR